MMPKSIALALAFPLALGIGMLTLYLSWTVQPVIVGRIIFFGSILSIIVLMPLLASVIQRFVRWTPNPRRDRVLQSESIRLIKSITILCGACAVLIDVWVHHRLNLFDITMVLGMLLMIWGKSGR